MTGILLLAGLLALSGFFSGVETAYTSLSPSQLHSLTDRWPKQGALVQRLIERPDRLLSTILIGNNLVNIAAASLATVLATSYFGATGPGIATGALTILVLIFGEVTPKQIAIIHNERIACYTAVLISVLEMVFLPLVLFVSSISSALSRLSGGTRRRTPTPEGILSMVRHAASMGVLSSNESWLVKNVFRFNDVTVSMIMTHRTKVFSLDKNSLVSEVLPDIFRRGFSRFPVYDQDPERIVGIVHARDLAQSVSSGDEAGSGLRLKDVMMSPIFVPETHKVETMLAQFRRERKHLAVVLDEYGGLAGIVTLEDVIEEIFGEIYDESDLNEKERIVAHPDGSYRIAGSTPLYTVNERLSVSFPHRRNVQTIAGYISERIGRIPHADETVETPHGMFRIEEISRKQVLSVRFIPNKPAEMQENEKKL